MKVMVVGGGAREHALCRRLALDPDVGEVVCVPGNPGIAAQARTVAADPARPEALLEIAAQERIDLTVIGPEIPLAAGVSNRFRQAGRLLLGPTAEASRLETSKAFAKSFMIRHGVPTARFRTCDTAADALACLDSAEFGYPVVLKADGLAAGKGVVVAPDQHEARAAVAAIMEEQRFGSAGSRLVIEECLRGPEVSFFVVSDGARVVPIGTAQDHKRVFDGDTGPNTGGMGAFAPSPLVTDSLEDRVLRDIVDPVIGGMAAEGHPFRGFLYVGLMLTPEGPKVIEFNVRLGDPEAQVILPLLSEPLAPLLAAAAAGKLPAGRCRIADEKVVGVVLASRGYPERADAGRPIAGVDAAGELPGVTVYHAGTALLDGQLVTAGGRVLTVTGRGPDFRAAIAAAYAGVGSISFDGMHYRRDIGRKAMQAVT